MPAPFLGKFRGTVDSNVDPLQQGRLLVAVPAVLGSTQARVWAMPCAPYGGPGEGLFALPPPAANVWVEFEGGDPAKAVWTGVFWGQGDAPVKPAAPATKVIRTARTLVLLDDGPTGGITIQATAAAVPTRIRIDQRGIELVCGTTSLLVGPDRIEVGTGPSSVTVATDGVTLGNNTSRLELGQQATVTSSGGAKISLGNATVSINNGALEVV